MSTFILCKKKAFTLIETMVFIAVSTMLFLGVSQLFVSVIKTPNQQLSVASDADQARTVLFKFVNEMRNATSGNDGSYSLNKADDFEVIFYSNYSATNSFVHRVRYFLSGSTLYKGVVIPSGNPLIYNLASEQVVPVQNNIVNDSIPIFYYYDGNYDGDTNALSQPVNLNQVKFVKMNMVISKQNTASTTSSFVVSGGATVRSLKDNLGN